MIDEKQIQELIENAKERRCDAEGKVKSGDFESRPYWQGVYAEANNAISDLTNLLKQNQ